MEPEYSVNKKKNVLRLNCYYCIYYRINSLKKQISKTNLHQLCCFNHFCQGGVHSIDSNDGRPIFGAFYRILFHLSLDIYCNLRYKLDRTFT